MRRLLLLVCCALHVVYGRIASDFVLHKTPQFTLIKPHPNDITINIMMHFDKVLTEKLIEEHGARTRKKLKSISNNILRDVEQFFRHPSLNQNIKFKLKDTRFLKNNTKIVKMDENGSLYLKSYCEWQGQRKLVNDWHYSVLLTGLDLYYLSKNGEEVRRSTGRGYVGGMCSIKNSCSLLEWNSKNIGYLLAHEIAHSLGINHDGPPFNQCRGQRHMMGARYNPDNHPRIWSPCSKHALNRYLTSEKSWCLHPGVKRTSRNLRLT